jgi:predicted nucleotidyltransferase
MKAVGIVAEYNPFHNGHYYHLSQSKKVSGADVAICVISGDFVQRGEPAMIDKFTRTQMALKGGADLIIMLPFAYSCQSAEIFAYGAVYLLNKLACGVISFGCENDDIKTLYKAAKIVSEENEDFKTILKKHLSSGRSFAKSRQLTVEQMVPESVDLLGSPNNILAIEYIKQIISNNYPITPLAIRRCGSNHNTKETDETYASASYIREMIKNKDSATKKYVPSFVYDFIKCRPLNELENYKGILYQNLLIKSIEQLCSYPDVSEDLANRLFNNFKDFLPLAKYIDCVYNKHHTKSRISRSLCHILTDFNIPYDTIKKYPVPYVRILGFNEKGKQYLHSIKDNENFISNVYDYYKHCNGYAKQIFDYDLTASDVFQLNFHSGKGIDYRTAPIYYK